MNILPGNPALKWISTSVLALGLTACGGGGGAGPSTGVLYDAPISNVEYDGSFPGTTDNSGEFQYAEGDSLIFKLGNFSFPAVPAGATIGLTDLLAAAEVNNQVINLARLLQSIDTDADPELITLPDTTGIDLTALDFDQTLADFEADATVQTLLAQHGNQTNPLTLIPTQDAVNHLYASALALGVDLPNVSVSLDNDGDHLLDAFDPDDDNDNIGDTVDVDDDNNGLIEISSLQQLDWVRNNLDGTSLNDGTTGDNTGGCPSDIGCIGYELTQNLNFDINGDGVMDAGDAPYFDYDNDGSNSGWLPIGDDSSSPFTAIFEGNGYEIRNLFISRPSDDVETSGDNIGLFGHVTDGFIRNTGLAGDLLSVTGNNNVGGLAGALASATVTGSYVIGVVTGDDDVGGLAGQVQQSIIASSYTSATVNSRRDVGGLAGRVANTTVSTSYAEGSVNATHVNVGGLMGRIENSILSASYATNTVTGDLNVGGLAGLISNSTLNSNYSTGVVTGNSTRGALAGTLSSTTLIANYWTTDSNPDLKVFGFDNGDSIELDVTEGVLLSELQCPTSANNISCSSVTLFSGWDEIDHDDDDVNTAPISPWVFGDDSTLPVLDLDLEVPFVPLAAR